MRIMRKYAYAGGGNVQLCAEPGSAGEVAGLVSIAELFENPGEKEMAKTCRGRLSLIVNH